MTDTELAQLIDQRRDLAAQLAGVELQIAMAVGDRDGARILAALKLYGPSTAAELQNYTGLTVVQADRRLPDLAKASQARVVQCNGSDMTRKGYRVLEAV